MLLIVSCTQNKSAQIQHQINKNYVVVENVPFIRQKDKFCGPAAMASVMQFYGVEIDQDEVAEEVYIEELDGALISDMENFAKDNGYITQSVNGNLELLKQHISNDQPVILLVDKGKWKVSVPHYYVAYGYSEQEMTILIHTGYKSGQEISFEDLNKEWEKMNKLMLVISK